MSIVIIKLSLVLNHLTSVCQLGTRTEWGRSYLMLYSPQIWLHLINPLLSYWILYPPDPLEETSTKHSSYSHTGSKHTKILGISSVIAGGFFPAACFFGLGCATGEPWFFPTHTTLSWMWSCPWAMRAFCTYFSCFNLLESCLSTHWTCMRSIREEFKASHYAIHHSLKCCQPAGALVSALSLLFSCKSNHFIFFKQKDKPVSRGWYWYLWPAEEISVAKTWTPWEMCHLSYRGLLKPKLWSRWETEACADPK